MNNIEANYIVVDTKTNVYNTLRYDTPEYRVVGDYHSTLTTLESAIKRAAEYSYLDLIQGELKIYALVPIELNENVIKDYNHQLLLQHERLSSIQKEKKQLHKRKICVNTSN
jgi:hypothetical protein